MTTDEMILDLHEKAGFVQDLPGEMWKPVVGYEGLYEVSDKGRVKSLARMSRHPRPVAIPDRLIAGSVSRDGRRRVTLHRDGRQRVVLVHKLVAEAFLGPRPPGMECRHMDGDCDNNATWNLAYGTAKENAADRERHGNTLRGERHGSSKLTDSQRIHIAYLRRCARMTQRAVAAKYGVSQCCIGNAVAYVRDHLQGDSAAAIKALWEGVCDG